MEFVEPDFFKSLLETLISKNPGVLAAAIVTHEGLPIVSIHHEDVEDARLAAISATLHSVSNIYLNDMRKGSFEYFVIESSKGFLVLVSLDDENLIIASTDENIRLGLIFLSIREIFSASGGFGRVSQDFIIKIFSLLNEKNVTQMTVERKELPNLFDEKALINDETDGLPTIKPAVFLYCKSKGVVIEIKESMVQFEKVY
jgi:predicted regulator of Ras-like GTPase activity (Roadblock/LC7/MglB family)